MIQCECCRARVKANTGNSRSGLALVCHCPGQGCGRHVVRLASSPSRAAKRKEQKLRRGVYHCRARSHSPSRGRHPQPRGCRGAEGHTLRVTRAPAAERGRARPHDGRGPAGRGGGAARAQWSAPRLRQSRRGSFLGVPAPGAEKDKVTARGPRSASAAAAPSCEVSSGRRGPRARREPGSASGLQGRLAGAGPGLGGRAVAGFSGPTSLLFSPASGRHVLVHRAARAAQPVLRAALPAGAGRRQKAPSGARGGPPHAAEPGGRVRRRR